MEKHLITLEVEESSKEMAHQLLALAIKKKYKDQIRPFENNGNGPEQTWKEIAGQDFDW